MTARGKEILNKSGMMTYRAIVLSGMTLIGYWQKDAGNKQDAVLLLLQEKNIQLEREINEAKRSQQDYQQVNFIEHHRLDDKIEKLEEKVFE